MVLKGEKGLSRKFKAGTLAAVAVAMALSGCSGNGGSAESPAPGAASAAATAASSQPVEIKWMQYPAIFEKDSYGVKYMEEKFNVKLTHYSVSWEEAVQKQQLQLATNDVPDVLFVNDPANLFKYVSQGLIAEVKLEDIAKYMPRYKKKMDEYAPQAWAYSNYQGKNYGFPTFYWSGRFNAKTIWRADLLEKAGVAKIPETIDEYTTAFEALKKIGVYGISTNGKSYSSAFHTIFGAYGVMPMQWMLKDGKVVNGAVQPEARAALEKLAQWYKAGYIEPDFATGADLGAKFIAGKYALFDSGNPSMLDEANPNSSYSSIKKLTPDGKLAVAPLPKGPEGKSGGWAWGGGGQIWAFGKQVEKDPAKMAKVMQIIEQIANDEQTFIDLSLGVQGKHWDYNDPALKNEGGIKTLDPYKDKAKKQAEGMSESFGVTLWSAQVNPDLFEKYTKKDTIELMKLYNAPLVDLFGKSDVLPSAGKYYADLQKLKVETYARIVMGEQPITYFDSFVKKWEEIGGGILEQEANEFYKNIGKK
ncbi:MAG: extracellular solute-binding protein family 1 [Paenibacillaceae bacterium]|jgi:putative aldouronate transport system substrate-binding protein|nr:extracellular solute-binding protein family 1 [Paenibacillaceae bacterium]